MEFHSANFLVFFILIFAAFWALKKLRLYVLVVANVLFYAAAGLNMLFIFVAVTIATFLFAHLIHARKQKKMYLSLGIVLNTINLVFFKYTTFLLDTAESFMGASIQLPSFMPKEILLPIGISFYTFQLIAYLVDVYRNEITPTTSFVKFWVFISLFPQLVAGPIMRGNELIPQLDDLASKRIRWSEVKLGVYIFIVGILKKIALADPIAQFVNPLFAKGLELTGVESWLATYAFGFQIYFDFSAYSDMALGLGLMIGIRFVLNFRSPYISSNPSEFWNRWHISLSRWIRDYIYIPLGGNRKGKIRVQFNLLAAMLISGLWHGAMWTFVVWGGVHGLLQVIYRWTTVLNRYAWIKRLRASIPYRIVSIFVFFHIVTWTWVFFRAQDFTQSIDMTVKMWTVYWPDVFTASSMWWIVGLYALHLLEYVGREYADRLLQIWRRIPFFVRSVAYTVIVLVVFYFLKGETYEFIYFQF